MSVQAVGGAVGYNSISLIIPCHRVVGTNGSLTGYAGGIDKKVKLLTLEKVNMPNKIFAENFSPYEFMIYCFLVSVGGSKGVSFWSVPKMAKKCNMCPTTCRITLKSLEEKGYIDITRRFIDNAQQSNIYTVHQI